jgi:nitrate reductase NapAB chaperone NapD
MDKFLWSINFEGVHPVGAVAIVIACDETDACNQLYKTLKRLDNVLASNNDWLLSASLKTLETALDKQCKVHISEPNKCVILLDGEY